MTARVVGLDLSLSATGVAESLHTWTLKPQGNGDGRLLSIVAALVSATAAADLVVIEDLPPVRAHNIADLGMVHGVVRMALLERRIPYVLITPGELKKFATGRGTADKIAMAVALYKRAGLELADDNQTDARWLHMAGLELLGEPVVQLPAAQVAALDKVRAVMGGAA